MQVKVKQKPPFRPRPRLAHWLLDHGLTQSEFAARVGVKPQQVSDWCAPFDDERRDIPTQERMADIFAETGGEITPADFYPPSLSGEGAAVSGATGAAAPAVL